MNLPNKISIARICLIPLFLLFILPYPEWLLGYKVFAFLSSFGKYISAVIFIVAASTDAVDGYIARKTNQMTKFGKFIDPIADKLLVAAALFALVQINELSAWIAMIIIGREFLVTGLRLVAASEGVVIQASSWGKIKTVLQMSAIVATLIDNYPLSLFTQFPLDNVLMFLAVIATIWSGYEYFVVNHEFIDTF